MRKIIKSLLTITVIAFIAITCFTACDMIGELVGGIGGGSNCNHEFVEVNRDANCMNGGYVLYECIKCGINQHEYIGPTDHEPYTVEGYDATCYDDGLTDGVYCSFCGITIEEPEVIPASHTIQKIEAIEPNCTQSGRTEGQICSVCNTTIVESEYLDEKHEFQHYDFKEATCTEAGYTEGEKCMLCGYIAYGLTPIDMSGHLLEVTEYGYDATCLESGLTDAFVCNICGFKEGHKTIEPYGHRTGVDVGYDATCYSTGLTDGATCSVCDTVVTSQTIIPMTDHTPETVPGYAATCTTLGLTDGAKCTVCEATITEQVEIPLTKHTEKTVNGYAATCTSNGVSASSVCSDCGKVLKSQYTIYSNGHVYGSDGQCSGCDLKITAALKYEEYIVSTFSLTSGGTSYIVVGIEDGYTGSTIVIPETYNGCPVIGIQDNAFIDNIYIEHVVIPESVVSIGGNAFYGCTSLKTIEYGDFDQFDVNMLNSALGDNAQETGVVFKATSVQGKSPYDIYMEAMNSINHNLKNYTWSMSSKCYVGYDFAVSYEQPSMAGELMLQIDTVQKQSGDNFYVSQTETDYMGGGTPQTTSLYYVDGYFYQPNSTSWLRCAMSKECWYGAMMTDISTIEITPAHFSNVVFYKGTDGKMYLELAFDPELFTELVENISGMPMEGLQIGNPVYKYVFDENGELESYGYTSTLQMTDPSTMTTLTFFDMEVISTISNRGSTYISAPAPYTEVNLENVYCKYGHTPVDVEGIEATCFAEGRSAYTYCSNCYAAITQMTVTQSSHDYVNGWCTECGDVEYGANISTGLAYVMNEDQTGYIVVGIGDCTDTDVYIPTHIYSLPIVEVKADAFAQTNVETVNIGTYSYLIAEFTGWKAE